MLKSPALPQVAIPSFECLDSHTWQQMQKQFLLKRKQQGNMRMFGTKKVVFVSSAVLNLLGGAKLRLVHMGVVIMERQGGANNSWYKLTPAGMRLFLAPLADPHPSEGEN